MTRDRPLGGRTGRGDDRMKKIAQATCVAWILRLSMIASVVMTFVTIGKVVIAGSKTDLTEFNKYIDTTVTLPLHDWQLVGVALFLMVWVTPLLVCFWKLNQLMGQLNSRDYFAIAAEQTIRSIGWTLITFWAIDYLMDTFGPLIITYYEPGGPTADYSAPFNAGLIFVVIGTILISLAKVLAEGRRLAEESKLIV
jgi:hypothetical protein